jgi:putative DNA primase/helicase
LRGRGAFVDGQQIIVNTGGEARIGSKTVPLDQVSSRFIYEAGDPWDFGFGTAATGRDAQRLVDVCNRLTWADAMSGALMCGWCVIAPVSGALFWRPHAWLTGPSGSGKTTALDIIMRIVGPSAEKVDGKVTEAAIRQLMGFDARPVIFDEAEGAHEFPRAARTAWPRFISCGRRSASHR